MKITNEIIVSPATIHHSHAECLRIVPIILKIGTFSLACPRAHGKREMRENWGRGFQTLVVASPGVGFQPAAACRRRTGYEAVGESAR
jgi:hypothetical protein